MDADVVKEVKVEYVEIAVEVVEELEIRYAPAAAAIMTTRTMPIARAEEMLIL